MLKIGEEFKNIIKDLIKNEGVVLYSNSSGTNGNITLSETTANFKYIEVFYGADGYYNSLKIYEPNGKKVGIPVQYIANNYQYFYNTSCSISGNKINQDYAINHYIGVNNNVGNFGTALYNKIYRVVGYK